MDDQAWLSGFIEKCAELGLDEDQTFGLLDVTCALAKAAGTKQKLILPNNKLPAVVPKNDPYQFTPSRDRLMDIDVAPPVKPSLLSRAGLGGFEQAGAAANKYLKPKTSPSSGLRTVDDIVSGAGMRFGGGDDALESATTLPLFGDPRFVVNPTSASAGLSWRL